MRTDQVDLQQANVGHLILAMGHDGTQKAFEKVGDDEWQRMGAGINYSDAGVRAWAFDYCDLEQRQPIQVPSDVARERLQAKLRGVSSVETADMADKAERIVGRRLSHLSKRDDWAEDDTAVGGQAAHIVSLLTEAGLIRSGQASDGQVIEVHHHDVEAHAESYNEGFDVAMSLHSMSQEELDSGISAQDWLQGKLRAARAAVNDEAVERVRSYMEMCRRSDETRHVPNPGEPSGADLARAKAVIAAFLDVDWQASA